MASLHTKIKLYLEANSKTEEELYNDNIELENIGAGDYIKIWNVSGVAKPTDSQLNSYETTGNTDEKNQSVRATRKNLYGNIGDQLDEIFKNIDAWKTRIQKIKTDNPKE